MMPVPSIVECERLTLRAVIENDVNETYRAWLADPEVNRYLETRNVEQTLEMIRAFVCAKAVSTDEYLFAICLRDGEPHIGNIKLGPMRAAHGLADVSLFIGDRNYWRGGYGSEAIAGVTQFAFAKLGLNKVTASLYAPNIGSERAFLKAGWRKEAALRNHYILDGKPTDLVLMGISRDQWEGPSA